VAEEMSIWRLVVEGICSLKELESCWSIDDVERANAVLDMREHYQMKKSEQT